MNECDVEVRLKKEERFGKSVFGCKTLGNCINTLILQGNRVGLAISF